MLRATSKEVCPAKLLTEYAAIRIGTWIGPLFMWRSGRQVEASEVRLSLRRRLESAGEDITGLSAQLQHWISVRSGRQRSLRHPAAKDGQVEEQCIHEVCQAHTEHAMTLEEGGLC